MKNRILLILIVGTCFFYACDSETTADFPTQIIQDSHISDSIFNILLDDAKLICMDYYTNEEMVEIQNIEFKESHIAPILAALQIVYIDSVSFPALAIKEYDIHALCHQQLYHSSIEIDTSSLYLKNWNRYGFSDHLELDQIIDRFDLTLDSIYKEYYSVNSLDGINHLALANQLKKFSFIKNAESSNCIGDGSHIEILFFEADYIHLIYSYGWGDCLSGCINRHYWELGIHGTGLVEIIDESGKDLPKKASL
ncbi:hypothetical protein ACT3CE_10600 [Marinifilum sp. RC60d5]|uniref:hypothetical protein n=1 Tax=Marinifilum sp. RC60d5 TaxID=3458414 RepID=UPI004035E412